MTNDCICSNVPRIWRLAGVTRTVRLTVTKDGSPYDFTGLQTVLRIDRDNSDFHYEPQFTVEGDDNNIIVFTWAADKQPLGDYTIEVTVTDGSGNKDRVNWHGATGVRLVEYSNLVKGEDAAGVESDSELGLDGIFTMNGVGMDAYEEWLADGNEGSLHDYILWMQGPAREAAEVAEAQMAVIQSRADDDHTTAGSDHTRAAADHTTATGDHTRAEEDHTRAISDHTRAAQDHTSAVGDHMTAGQDHLRAEADHTTAGSDHTRAESDHATAASDHSTAASDHTKAGQDSTRAGSDHDIAVADHAQAEADHTRAESDHTTAAADHTTAASDHTTASSDHTTAAADHTQAVADHAVMAGYDTRLTNVETDVTQLGQKVDDLATGKYYGYFASASELPDDADVDGFAYVGSGPTYTVYNLRNGVWDSSGITVNQSPIGNEEDIDQDSNGKLQFANRVYDSQAPDGMGYKILRKNATFASQVTETNTIYEIRYDFNLSGNTVTIPVGCVLKFKGGCIKNGTIVGQDSTLQASLVTIFDDITLSGEWKNVFYPEWLGAVGDGMTDDTIALQKLDGMSIVLGPKSYAATNLVYGAKTSIKGQGRGLSILKQMDGSTGDFVTMLNWAGGILTNFSIRTGEDIIERNYQQALLKIKTTNRQTSSWKSVIDNISVDYSKYNGISILGDGEVDDGVTCTYNWIFTMSNVFVLFAERYCIYDKSTDNLFSNINCHGGGLADIVEKGSSNKWVNLKLDGEPCYNCDATNMSTLLADKNSGAALIVIGGILVSFLNLDVQSSRYVGVKLVNATRTEINGSINNCAKDVLAGQKELSPALYVIGGARYCNINLLLEANENQYKQFGYSSTANIYDNNILFASQSMSSGQHAYEMQMEALKPNNLISNPVNLHGRNNYRYLKNILPPNLETSTAFTLSGSGIAVENTGAVFGGTTPSFHFSNTSNLNAFYIKDAYTAGMTKGALCVVMFVVKPIAFGNDKTLPYINLAYYDGSHTARTAKVVRQDNIQDAQLQLNEKYLVCNAFVVNKNYNGDMRVALFRAADSGEFQVSNVKLYNLTDDFGLGVGTLSTDRAAYNIMEFIFSANEALLSLESEFNHILVPSMDIVPNNPIDNGPTECYPPYPSPGQLFFDKTLGKMIVWNGTAWVNTDGTALS